MIHSKISAAPRSLALTLEDGEAERVGDGMFVIFQTNSERRRQTDNVVISSEDLGVLRLVPSLTVELGDGIAEYVGDGYWSIFQTDGRNGKPQNVILSGADISLLLGVE